jgi:hypothetical protein
MDIDDLLNKYFEGETSGEEERRLRAFFASDNVPRRLAIYKPMFAYFDDEIRKKQEKPVKSNPATRRYILYVLSAAAACLVLLLGIKYFLPGPDPCLCSENYVVINGRCYTDMQKIKEFAFDALQEVATPATIEDQLNELSTIFSDDD